MYSNLPYLLCLGFLVLHLGPGASGDTTIIHNGFKGANLTVDGEATITPNGLLRLTNYTKQQKGHAFHPDPIPFKPSLNGSVLSFSASFVFGIISQYPNLSGHGLVFVITPTRGLPYSLPSQHLGLFNETNNGNETNHVVGVEVDTIQNLEFGDINDNHLGIDIDGLQSATSAPARYAINATSYANVSLYNNGPLQVWIDYDASVKQMNVTLGPIKMAKPAIPLLSLSRDLSPIFNDSMYIGFSSSTGSMPTAHYILGWSFSLNGKAPSLDINSLPNLPNITVPQTPPPVPFPQKNVYKILMITTLPLVLGLILIVAMCFGIFYWIRRKKKFSEELEDWESEYGPHRFKYKDLYVATKGFQDKDLLGKGGFGRVYKGVLPKSMTEVAVKKVSHDSQQGMKEFVAEIVSMGRLRHRNLVQLLGYCRRKGELLLVYEYMSNGSLDKSLYQNRDPDSRLDWDQRFKIIKGVASGLLYLHEGWEQIVVHRDIKASNVLLDSDLNARLGDFGLARLQEHGTDPQTTHVMGTLGYLAPEHSRTGKATKSSDVFAFGAFLLEVACGRRPVDVLAPEGESVLVEVVFDSWKRGDILRVVDHKLEGKYVKAEAAAVLKLGLLCSNVEAEERPKMAEVVTYLDGGVALPDVEGLELGLSCGGVSFLREAKREGLRSRGFNDRPVSYSSSTFNMLFTDSTSVNEYQLPEGR